MTTYARLKLPLIPLALIAAAATQPALAQSRHAQLSVASRYDDNVFRVPEQVTDTLAHKGVDVVTYVALNGGLKTNVGAVETGIDGGVGQSLYANHPSFDAVDYRAAATATYETQRAIVNAAASYLHEPLSFDEILNTSKLLHSKAEAKLDGSKDLLGNIRLVGRLNYLRNSVSGGRLQANGATQIRFGGGFGYFSPTGNSITLEYVETRATGLATSMIRIGDVMAAYRSDYREYAVRSQLYYRLSDVTLVRGSIGYARHEDRSVLDVDFAGLEADMSVTWSPLPSMTVTPSFRRSFSSESRLFSNGVRVTSYAVAATETLFGVINTNFRLSREERRFQYDVQADNPLNLSREDRTTRLTVGLSYQTGSKIVVSLQYDYVRRTSGKIEFPYRAGAILLTLSRGINI